MDVSIRKPPMHQGLRELDIIALVSRTAALSPETLADDAFYEVDTRRIYTTDLLIEGRHFDLSYFSPEDLGWKAAAVNISDIAAMGGRPQYLLVSVGLPNTVPLDWIESLYKGLQAACQEYGCAIIGGDTVGSDHIVLNVTAIGECPTGYQAGFRNQARPGDVIVATGYHGLSTIGLQALQENLNGYHAAKAAHRRPKPRVEEALILSERYTRYALMDSSDGLADALLKIAQASGVHLVLEAAKLPIHPDVESFARNRNQDPLELALYGGEDFQLVACLPEVPPDLMAYVKVIGRVEVAENGQPSASVRYTDGRMEPLTLDKTYQHFGNLP